MRYTAILIRATRYIPMLCLASVTMLGAACSSSAPSQPVDLKALQATQQSVGNGSLTATATPLAGRVPVVSGPSLVVGQSPAPASRIQPPTASTIATSAPSADPTQSPGVLQIGTSDAPGGAAALHQAAPFGLRYQYLAGGANTGKGWATWNPSGSFVDNYIKESKETGTIPVFSYYMLRQSLPGSATDDSKADLANLRTLDTMTAYFTDIKLFFQRSANFPDATIVLHVEPDLWGFLEQASPSNRASDAPVYVSDTGLPELTGLPNNAAGFAQAIRILRDTYAPNVLLAYHLSIWGTGDDIQVTKPNDGKVVADARRAAAFYDSLGSPFDLIFTDASDRDAGFKQYIGHDGGASFWSADDYRRNILFLGTFHASVVTPIVLWQIPLGNTKMRAENNTWDHYQDNHVEMLIGDPDQATLKSYAAAGVIALLFGRGADGATCACDANNDGITNPPAINGNTELSVSADDDGGYFKQEVSAYYQRGGLALPQSIATR